MTTPDNPDDVARVARGLTQAQRRAIAGAHRVSSYSDVRHVHCDASIHDRQVMMDAGLLLGWQLTASGQRVRAHLLAEQPR